MVHTRINERAANPNAHINFICALPSPHAAYGSAEDSEAKELLRALAAQLRPVMKQHGLTVNSFEEYENNKVFLGRNWNNGETIELVLRDGGDNFYPASRLLGVFCHELAHIKHMNHSSAFHAFRRQLSSEVAALQREGYYGDGYWSAGTRLSDSERISGEGAGAQELPEYTCGGAHAQSRSSALPSRRRRRRARRLAGPSLTSGAQNAKQRKAGSRVTSKTAFEAAGQGNVIDERVEKGGKGSGFRKKAGSQRAREERALAAERRLKAMQGESLEKTVSETESETDEEGEGSESDRVTETDRDRLKWMRNAMGEDDLKAMRDDTYDDVVIVSVAGMSSTGSLGTKNPRDGDVKRKSAEEGDDAPSKKRRRDGENSTSEKSTGLGFLQGPSAYLNAASRPSFPASSSSSQGSTRGNILEDEVRQRKREALGMDRPRTLGVDGSGSKPRAGEWTCDLCTFINTPGEQSCAVCEQPRREEQRKSEEWSCSVCTYNNGALDGKCTMCDHLRVQ